MPVDLLREYAIPYLHPLAVHFPLVLLLLAAAAAVAYAVDGRALARGAALGLLLAGATSAWAAIETGETLAHAVEGEPMADAVLPAHEDLATWTLRLSLLASVVAAGATLAARRRISGPSRDPLAWRLGVAAAAALAAVAVAVTAHLGGIMVWGVPAAP